MRSYPYSLLAGYPVMELEGLKALLHTGTSQSVGQGACVSIDGITFPLIPPNQRMDLEQLGRRLGSRVDVVLGADVLTQFDYKLLPETGEVVFTTGEFHPYGVANHFDLYRGVPIIPVSLANRDRRLFFVTAARRTYLQSALLGKLQPSGEVEDYYPGLGSFTTLIFEVNIWVAGYDVVVTAGVCPPLLGDMLNQTRSHGILGIDVLQGFEVCLAPRRREGIWWRLGFRREEGEGERRDPNDIPGYYY